MIDGTIDATVQRLKSRPVVRPILVLAFLPERKSYCEIGKIGRWSVSIPGMLGRKIPNNYNDLCHIGGDNAVL